MSEFENTNLPFLEQDCIEFFGEEQGQNVFGKTLSYFYSTEDIMPFGNFHFCFTSSYIPYFSYLYELYDKWSLMSTILKPT